jgi:D-alanyl-D-alanine carboxypeptidase (penicillin-binding protein 5/6)
MNRLHNGHRRRSALAVTAFAVLTAVVSALVGASPAARADTVGGDQLASTHRTVSLGPDAKPLPDVWAESWLLADATTGEVLAQKGSHVRRPPASTLKTLTALTVLPQTTLDQQYIATPRAAGIYGARVGLRPGKTYTLEDLWYALFLHSANDAAIAVAQANGGVHKTVRQMNDVAANLNARDTTVRNTTGLDSPGQLSSAYDLALIGRAGMQREDFAHFAGTKHAEFPNVKGKGSHSIYTTNRLMLHGWKGMIGVKTGFTTKAGRTYVGAAKRGDRTLIVTLMGIHESTESAAKKLLRWGFKNADKVTPVGTLVNPGPLPEDPQPSDPGATSPPSTSPVPAGSTGTSAAGPGLSATGVPWVGLLLVAGLGAVLVVAAVAALTRRPRRDWHA